MAPRSALAAIALVALAAASVATAAPLLSDSLGAGWESRWTHSSDAKYSGRFTSAEKGDGVQSPEPAKHYGLTRLLDEPVSLSSAADGEEKDFVFQYDVKFTDGLTCGGAYAKLLSKPADASFKAEDLVDSTPFSVMFGPDKCGATNKVHLIIKHAQPNGTVAERHLVSPPLVEGNGSDKLTHVYTLILRPSNSSFDLLIDGESRRSGSLLDAALFDPPFVPPKEIDDAEDKKPEDWVDVERIPDPEATKPDDWDEDAPREVDDADAVKPEGWLDDEPPTIPDPEASQPEDWDEDEDGAWEAPSVPNPKCAPGSAPGCGPWTRPKKPNPDYKGKWTAPLVANPAYKGPWKPRKVPNPDYYDDAAPLKNVADVAGVAFELWTMDKGYTFGNVVVADDAADAAAVRAETWEKKRDAEKAAAEKEAEEAREKAKKLAAEAEAKAKKEAKEKEAEDGTTLAERIASLFDEGAPLEAFADAAEPLLDALDEREWLAWALVAVPAAILLAPIALVARRGGKGGDEKKKSGAKKAAAAAAAKGAAAAAAAAPASNKKKDVSTADDKAEADDAAAAAGGDDDSDDKAGGAARRRAARRD